MASDATTTNLNPIDELGGESLLDAGLRYARRGWRIFPVDGRKEPLTPHGFKNATTMKR
jgi:hypothetical protein